MIRMPKISVVMAVNRDEGYLAQAIESILHQTLTDFEFIIVANNCTDALWTSLGTYRDSRIRLFRTSLGQLAFSLNLGVHKSRSPLIARMDADDISLPNRMARQFEYMNSNPDVAVLGTNYEIVDSRCNTLQRESALPQHDVDIRRRLPIRQCIAHPTVMIRRNVFLEVGGYSTEVCAEDYDLWLRIRRLKSHKFHNLPDVLLRYRVHAAQASTVAHYQRLCFAYTSAMLGREFLLTHEARFALGAVRAYLRGNSILRSIKNAVRR